MSYDLSDYILFFRLSRLQSSVISPSPEAARNEGEFYDAIYHCDNCTLSKFNDDPAKTSSFACGNWDFIKRCAKAVASTGNVETMKIVLNIFVGLSTKPDELGEIFALETISSGRPEMVTGLLQYWAITRNPFVSETYITVYGNNIV